MSNIAGSVYSSANTSASTLRPRNTRLISYLDDSPADGDLFSQAASTSTSRGASPSAAQPRNRNAAQPVDRSPKSPPNRTTQENTGRRSSSLWDSWSSIQEAASSLLGANEASSSMTRRGSIRTPAWMKQDPKFKTTTAIPKWGPDTQDSTTPTPGSIEDRKAAVQAKKREALLLSCARDGRNEIGHIKRKLSYDAGAGASSPRSENGAHVLVYKHEVQPQDTMAGVTIKYGCQPEAFRKMNRFWASDNIQTRAYVLLPVDACSVRGQKVDDASSLELLNQKLNKIELNSQQTAVSTDEGSNHLTDRSPTVASPSLADSEDGLQHESFVILPSRPDPVEILRVLRNTTGYFPRPRRKSNHFPSESVRSTPKTSFDLLRHPPTHAAQQAAAAAAAALNPMSQSISLETSPARRPALTSSSRQRSSSATNAATASAASSSAWTLRGPGGVGDLRGLRTETSRPGPADDPLNQKFAHYFPGLALQPDKEESGNSTNFLHPRSRTNTSSQPPYKYTPRASTDSIRSTRSNSSTFGAGVTGVENFMRKLTSGSKRPDLMPRSSSGSLVNAMGLPVGGDTGLGDLIELETNPDALHHHYDDIPADSQSQERGRSVSRRGGDDDDDLTPTATGKSQEDLFNERFPVRGRITRAYVGDNG